MESVMSVAVAVNRKINQLKQFLQFSESYLRRHNPLLDAYNQIEMTIKNILTINKKLKIAKYRVNHLNYRLHQMEQLIENGNPYNKNSGKTLNLLR